MCYQLIWLKTWQYVACLLIQQIPKLSFGEYEDNEHIWHKLNVCRNIPSAFHAYETVVTVVHFCLNWGRVALFVNYTLSAWSNLLGQDKSQWPDGKSGCIACPEWSMCPTKFTTLCLYMLFRSEKVSVMLFPIPRLHMLRWLSTVLKHENIPKAKLHCQAKQEY